MRALHRFPEAAWPVMFWPFSTPMEYRRAQRDAHRLFTRAMRDGLLRRPKRCSKCRRAKSRIHAHHHDYTKPLDVQWLCSLCHHFAHSEIRVKASRVAGVAL